VPADGGIAAVVRVKDMEEEAVQQGQHDVLFESFLCNFLLQGCGE
jgi:hypothetical protein